MLLAIPWLTARRLLQISRTEGSAEACLRTIREGKVAPPKGERGPPASRAEVDPLEAEAALEACGARIVAVGEASYPARLADLADPPAALFVRGKGIDRPGVRVSIVGARNCSPLGREVAQALGRDLAAAGVCVISGAARGIDAAAHRGALEAGGATVAVLGCGLDVAYPPQHAALLDAIAEAGGVVSEYPPGVPAQPFRFPARNRIVAALADAIVVVEGAAGSGSLITADHALDLGRPVYAVPGPVTSPLSEVPLALIRDGATMIRGADDLLADLGVERRTPPPPGRDGIGEASDAAGPASLEDVVLAALSGRRLPEEIAGAVGRDLSEVVPALMKLELRGVVRSVGGRVERRLAAPG